MVFVIYILSPVWAKNIIIANSKLYPNTYSTTDAWSCFLNIIIKIAIYFTILCLLTVNFQIKNPKRLLQWAYGTIVYYSSNWCTTSFLKNLGRKPTTSFLHCIHPTTKIRFPFVNSCSTYVLLHSPISNFIHKLDRSYIYSHSDPC